MSPKGPIVCIEDDEDDQFLIQLAIQQLGVSNPVRFFLNGVTALNYLNGTSERPFLILCDVNMPLMNGIELHQQINASVSLRAKAIPFVFLTTAANKETVQYAYRQMIQGFYQKASTLDELKQRLTQVIEYWQTCLHPANFEE